MTKHWIIKNHHGEFLVGFYANGDAHWRSPTEPFAAPFAESEAIVYATEDLSRVAIPALVRADVDVFTVERYC